MTPPNESTPARVRRPRWPWAALALVLCVLASDVALHALRHNARLWHRLRDFTVAFGGAIAVVLLLAAGVGLLFLLDAWLFRDEGGGGPDSDAA